MHTIFKWVTGASLCVLMACGAAGGEGDGEVITVAAVTFAENQIVGEMYAAVLADAGYEVDRKLNFQDRESLLPQLQSGRIDVAPEYLASLLTALDANATPSSEPAENLDALEPLLAEDGLKALEPSAANDTNAFVVDAQTAKKLDLESVSDLAPHAQDLVFGGPPECPDRPFCLRGLSNVYGIEFKDFQPLDAGGPLTAAALSGGRIDVALLFSTSGVIAERGWVVLEDDKGLQAADNITPVVGEGATASEIEELLNGVSAALSTEEMTQLNARVEVDNEDFRTVAHDFLEEAGLL